MKRNLVISALVVGLLVAVLALAGCGSSQSQVGASASVSGDDRHDRLYCQDRLHISLHHSVVHFGHQRDESSFSDGDRE